MLNRILKLSISFLYFPFSKAAAAIQKLSAQKNTGTLVVITYHSVKPQQVGVFEKQIDRLLKAGRPVLANIGNPLTKSSHHIAVTFDDGFVNFVQNALPILQQRKIPATFFVPTGYLGKPPGWINNLEHENARETVISEEQLKELPKDQILIGSHCVTHPKLTSLDLEQAKMEMTESKKKLEAILGKKVALLSFPYNDYNDQTVEIARQAGYTRVFSNVPAGSLSKVDGFLLGRIEVSPEDWDYEYWLKLRGAYQWLPIASKVKRKLMSLIDATSPRIQTKENRGV